MASSICETSLSLLERLGKRDPQAWEDFSTKYTWMMRSWLGTWKISPGDIEDVLQDTCLQVFRNIHYFQHRGHGSFRAWLKEVSRICWLQVVRKSAHRAKLQNHELDLYELLSEETLWSIDSQIDLLIEQELFDHALALTRKLFSESIWNAYRLTALDGHSGAQAASLLGVSIDAVYKGRARFEAGFEQVLVELKQFN